MSKSPLYGKTLVAIGDSLFYGNKLGPEATWINKLGRKHNMTVYNYGLNGGCVACQSAEPQKPAMCVRYKDMAEGADYVVIGGGANDKRLSVPLGEGATYDTGTFKGALRTLILGVSAKYPKARILCMTNYNRWPSKNKLGYSDINYVDAMLEVCAEFSIPCFDNYRMSGISFQNPVQCEWMDEGLRLGMAANHHFSDEAYDWLLPKYEKLLESI